MEQMQEECGELCETLLNEKHTDMQPEVNNQRQHMQIALVIEMRATRKLINYAGESFGGLRLLCFFFATKQMALNKWANRFEKGKNCLNINS